MLKTTHHLILHAKGTQNLSVLRRFAREQIAEYYFLIHIWSLVRSSSIHLCVLMHLNSRRMKAVNTNLKSNVIRPVNQIKLNSVQFN